MTMMKSSEMRMLLEQPLKEMFDDPVQSSKNHAEKHLQYIKESYPNGVPEMTPEEYGMVSGNARGRRMHPQFDCDLINGQLKKKIDDLVEALHHDMWCQECGNEHIVPVVIDLLDLLKEEVPSWLRKLDPKRA